MPSGAFSASISLRLLGREVYRLNGRDQDAAGELDMIDRLIQNGARRYATEEGFVTIGRFFLASRDGLRKVLDQFYDVVTKQKPDYLDAYYATAELAPGKRGLRSSPPRRLRKAPKAASQDPRFHYLLARALAPEDPGRLGKRACRKRSKSTPVMATVCCCRPTS